MKIYRYLIPMISALALAANSAAQETGFSVNVGATYSDNIRRVSANEESELLPEAGLQFSMARDGRLDADVSMNLQYRTYADDAFDDELLGGLDGRLSYEFIPERFSWTAEDNFGQSFTDRQAVETPDNRQNLNYFTTGPTLILPLGSRTSLAISGRWSDVDYEKSGFDSERLSGQVTLNRTLNETSALSLSLASQRVEFDQSPPNSDYDLHSAFLSYQARGTRTTIALRGGLTSLHDFGESTEGPLADVTLTRKLGARATLTLNAGTQFYDSAESFRRDREFADIALGNEDTVPSRDPFQQDYASVAWAIEGVRTKLRLGADWRSEDHETDLTLDRERVGASANVSRRVGPRLTMSLFGRYDDESFGVGNVDFDEWSAGASFDWALTAGIALALRAEHNDGSGDTSAGSGLRDYTENRYTLRLTYTPGR